MNNEALAKEDAASTTDPIESLANSPRQPPLQGWRHWDETTMAPLDSLPAGPALETEKTLTKPRTRLQLES